ncbi:MAG TPA: type III-B CRISPR module RAMP protein Cmr6 [Thermoanaerobaculia bacterium]|jgi:CRISPR-associated protein Cmr6|nr:type III-B CRISPR module RAMP protein Cmr6 [Thermoanaerobaculia bacterium]
MSNLPMPAAFRKLLDLEGEANRSLVFDRGMDQWTHRSGEKSEADKPGFFRAFVSQYRENSHGNSKGFPEFLARRAATLKALGAERRVLFTASRLAVGLGLPHPTETGFLFDRLTGCPCLPGSSLKGLLRAAAILAANGELPGAAAFWTKAQVDRVFGPVLGDEQVPATGAVNFYDVFPEGWPALEVDVLTPHYGSYYRELVPPGDWENPVPVPFLALREGQAFGFWIGPRDRTHWIEDCRQLHDLLVLALDWLGIGAKKASGYGYFSEEAPALPPPVRMAEPPRPRREDRPQPPSPPLPPARETPWDNVEIAWAGRSPCIVRGGTTVPCELERLPPDLQAALRDRKSQGKIRADVSVVRIAGGAFRLDRVKRWRRS